MIDLQSFLFFSSSFLLLSFCSFRFNDCLLAYYTTLSDMILYPFFKIACISRHISIT